MASELRVSGDPLGDPVAFQGLQDLVWLEQGSCGVCRPILGFIKGYVRAFGFMTLSLGKVLKISMGPR